MKLGRISFFHTSLALNITPGSCDYSKDVPSRVANDVDTGQPWLRKEEKLIKRWKKNSVGTCFYFINYFFHLHPLFILKPKNF